MSIKNINKEPIKVAAKRLSYLLFLSVVFLFGCVDSVTETTKREGEAEQRIIGKEQTVYKMTEYQIIEVDGVEYLSNSNGGMCPLIK